MSYSFRRAADPTMNQIARKLTDVKWITTLDEEETLAAHEMSVNKEARRKWVYPLPDYQSWAVRLYIGGESRTVGLLIRPKMQILSPALRFADMVAMYFWHHRVRGAHEPTDLELNFSVDRAKTDLEMETEAVALLKEIEEHLVSIGALKTSAEMEAMRHDRRSRKQRQRTVAGTLLEVSDVLSVKIDRVEKSVSAPLLQQSRKLDELKKEVERLNSVIELLLTRLPAVAGPNIITVTPWQSQAPSPTNLPPEYQPPLVTYGIPQTVTLPPQNIFPQTTCGDGSGPAPL